MKKGRPRVLFVDDDERVTRMLVMMFKGTYTVFAANSGEHGLQIIRSTKIDLIVTDHRMPGMSGIELLRIIRQESPHTIRVLLTGYWDLTGIIGAIAEGDVYRFLNKPWEREDMQAIIADCIQAALLAAEDKLGAYAASKVTLDSQIREEPEMLKQFMERHTIFTGRASEVPESPEVDLLPASSANPRDDQEHEDQIH